MRLSSFLAIIVLVLFQACKSGPDTQAPKFVIKTNVKGNIIQLNDTLRLSVQNPKNLKIDSLSYLIGDKKFENGTAIDDIKLGHHDIKAVIKNDGQIDTVTAKLTILNDEPPQIYEFEIINEYPHDISSYTQGLEFYDDFLYESTGQRGESKLRKVDYRTGTVLQNVDLDQAYFGEGLTIFNNKIYQLTWQSKVGLVYELDSLKRTGSFRYGKSTEGWGLCHDDSWLYKSDGTEKIWLLDPETLVETQFIQAFTNSGKVVGLNELEWVNGKIYANRYQKNGVAIINPENGAIEGVIDFSPLRNLVTQHQKLDVLNGIAFNPKTGTLFVTGKNWDKLFEVSIRPRE